MPDKPLMSLGGRRRAKPRTATQKKARSALVIREERLMNLAKARRKRAKNLRAAKKAAKVS